MCANNKRMLKSKNTRNSQFKWRDVNELDAHTHTSHTTDVRTRQKLNEEHKFALQIDIQVKTV